ncbi:MAG TPA: hypothetical protein PKE03_06755 [Bacteroidales bacterium]|nr:hypothetical protein [Bacteroidales bacterium]
MNLTMLVLIVVNLILLLLLFFLVFDRWSRLRKELSTMKTLLEKRIASQEPPAISNLKESVFPLKVQAAERLIVLIERIKPGMIVHRHIASASSSAQLAMMMLQSIREEFEYNISQQLYVSERSWQLITAAREEITQQIHLSLAAIEPDSGPENIARELFAANLRFPDEALASLRDELRREI